MGNISKKGEKKSVLLKSNKCSYYTFGVALSLLALYPWWAPFHGPPSSEAPRQLAIHTSIDVEATNL